MHVDVPSSAGTLSEVEVAALKLLHSALSISLIGGDMQFSTERLLLRLYGLSFSVPNHYLHSLASFTVVA